MFGTVEVVIRGGKLCDCEEVDSMVSMKKKRVVEAKTKHVMNGKLVIIMLRLGAVSLAIPGVLETWSTCVIVCI